MSYDKTLQNVIAELKNSKEAPAIDTKRTLNVAIDYKKYGYIDNIRLIYNDHKEGMSSNFIKVPESGIGDLSDGYHTFNSLYMQRLVLFATIVNSHPDISWKSYKHEDGELCFDGGWFVVGIDTPEGPYTYHYENKYFDLFKCDELEVAKHFDGHTDKDVTRLLSLI